MTFDEAIEMLKPKDEIHLEHKIKGLELIMDIYVPEELSDKPTILDIKLANGRIKRYNIPAYYRAHLKLYRYEGRYILDIYINKIVGIIKILEVRGIAQVGEDFLIEHGLGDDAHITEIVV